MFVRSYLGVIAFLVLFIFFAWIGTRNDARAFEPWISGIGLVVLLVMTLKLVLDG
jgi:hypothetical protein